MASRVAALLVLLGVFCIQLVSAQTLMDCCKTVSTKKLPLQVIASYSIQEEGRGCDIKATVIHTKGGYNLCVSHPDDQEWVRSHIEQVDNRTTRRPRTIKRKRSGN